MIKILFFLSSLQIQPWHSHPTSSARFHRRGGQSSAIQRGGALWPPPPLSPHLPSLLLRVPGRSGARAPPQPSASLPLRRRTLARPERIPNSHEHGRQHPRTRELAPARNVPVERTFARFRAELARTFPIEPDKPNIARLLSRAARRSSSFPASGARIAGGEAERDADVGGTADELANDR